MTVLELLREISANQEFVVWVQDTLDAQSLLPPTYLNKLQCDIIIGEMLVGYVESLPKPGRAEIARKVNSWFIK